MKKMTLTGALTLLLASSTAFSGMDNGISHSRDFGISSSTKTSSTFYTKNEGLKVDVHMRNFLKKDKKKVRKAVKVLLDVMNSKEFKQEVLNYTFKGKKQFNNNKGMTNQEIYDHLMTGAEDLIPEVDHTMNFDLTLYRSWNPFSQVRGYTNPNTKRIWIHKKFFRRRSWTPVDTAANMAHEWVHKMGFTHDYKKTKYRSMSVPYAVGKIVWKVAKAKGYK